MYLYIHKVYAKVCYCLGDGNILISKENVYSVLERTMFAWCKRKMKFRDLEKVCCRDESTCMYAQLY